MDLFKERLKTVCGYILAWVLGFILPATIFIWLISFSKSLTEFLSMALLSLFSLALLCMIFYGIYWLFVEPFRKTKEDK